MKSEWTDLPGGYTAYITVYEKENPNYNYIYQNFAYGKFISSNGPASEHLNVVLPKKAKVVCINRVTTKGLTDPGSNSEININLNASNFINII